MRRVDSRIGCAYVVGVIACQKHGLPRFARSDVIAEQGAWLALAERDKLHQIRENPCGEKHELGALFGLRLLWTTGGLPIVSTVVLFFAFIYFH